MSNNNTLIVARVSGEIPSLYVLKAVAAFLVVACHTPFTLVGEMLGFAKFVPVPLFFMLSGYFLYDADRNKSIQRGVKSLKKVVVITLVVNLIHALALLPSHRDVVFSIDVLDLLLQGGAISGHLWYLTAMIQALIIIVALLKWTGARRLYGFIPLIIVHLLLGKYPLLGDMPWGTFNVVCYGLPYMAIGFTIAESRRIDCAAINWRLWTVVTLFLAIGEHYLYMYLSSAPRLGIYLMTTPLVISLFCLMLQYRDLGRGTAVAKIGRDYSSMIYYFHLLVAVVVTKVLMLSGLYSWYDPIGSIWVFVASVGLSWFITRIQDYFGVSIIK